MLTCVCQPADARVMGPAAHAPAARVITRGPTRTAPPRHRPGRARRPSPGKVRDARSSKENLLQKLPDGVQLTLGELREMACRQQQQIESQHQLLAAKEQRLRYLKEQEARHQRVAAENERLRRLRDRVEAQELKLRKLRALRGQVDHHKHTNISLTSDLDSIRALFNEKEKELSLAVAKVDELTRQLEELRRGRAARDQPPPAAALELDKLRRELMYRNKLNEQQNARLCQQREALTARQEEMTNIDKRISELQDRLHRKRVLNQQLANQITAASHKTPQLQPIRPSVVAPNGQHTQHPHVTNGQQNGLVKQPTRGNIAAVEPYKHVPTHAPDQPLRPTTDAMFSQLQQQSYQPIVHQNDPSMQNYKFNMEANKLASKQQVIKLKSDDAGEYLSEFGASKSDPKYQTLPYNTKFTVNFVAPGKSNKEQSENVPEKYWNEVESQNNNMKYPNNNQTSNSQHMTVHSTPLSVINKSLATPLNQNDKQKAKEAQEKQGIGNAINGDHMTFIKNPMGPSIQQGNRQFLNYNGLIRGQPVGGPSSTVASVQNQNTIIKPISSVAPTAMQSNSKPSTIYQTSSTKIQPVQPQTIQSSPQLTLSPPQSTSTPVGTPETNVDKTPKPALPPKPAIKPPPRQTQPPSDDNSEKEPSTSNSETSEDIQTMAPPSTTVNHTDNLPIIKARPLQIKKQPLSEQPRLRSLNSNSKMNGYHISINRRIEMPPAFLFPETESPPADLVGNENGSGNKAVINSLTEQAQEKPKDEPDRAPVIDDNIGNNAPDEKDDKMSVDHMNALNIDTENVVMRVKKGNLKQNGKANLSRRVSFDPLALLLDASLEGELELVKKTASQVPNPSAANDEGITALHNAICAGHLEIVKFLVEFGCDVNAQDSDGWTPLHCAASCNNVAMVRFLVEHGACIFATTLSDHETAAEKCEEDEEGFDGCSEYLYSVQEKLGILSGGAVYAVFDYTAQQSDELSFTAGQQLTVLRKGDEHEREWWWARLGDNEGYIPRNLLGLYPRVSSKVD